MLGKFLDNMLHESEEELADTQEEPADPKIVADYPRRKQSFLQHYGLPILVFLLALGSRLYFLFQVSGVQNAGPNWYGDVYHHWQIAYLSKTVGFKHGFLRLWDLKGMEYFWGLLHPLVLIFLFTITGSIDIIVSRLLAIVCGAGVITILFAMVRRYFNTLTALAAAAWAIFFPVLTYSDALGMQDQLALFVLMLAIYFWPKKPGLTAVFFGLAAMGRSEYWIFGLGLILAGVLIERKFEQTVIVVVCWVIMIAFYMKYLLDQTGNPIYPVWWNYMGNAAGEWQVAKTLTKNALIGRTIFRIAGGVGVVGALVTFWKKPRSYMLLFLGFGSFMFNGIFFGFSAYIYSWVDRYYVDRIFNLSYMFAGVLLAVIFVYWLGRRIKIFGVLGFLGLMATLVGLQFIVWPPAMYYFRKAQEGWPAESQLAAQVAEYYEGGKVLIPEDRTAFTYALVRFGGVQGENIIGQMFDPYFYIEEADPYENWGENRETILDWLEKEDIRLIAFYPGRDRYQKLVEHEPERFEFLRVSKRGILKIYRVLPLPS